MTELADHPHTDPRDGRQQCDCCGKFVWPSIHSCKGVPVAPLDPDAVHFHPYPDDVEPEAFTDDEWLELMRKFPPSFPVGLSRRYVTIMRRKR